MKKALNLLVVLGLCFGLTGCGTKTNVTDTQKKIENAGWHIDLQRDVGTKVDDLILTINDTHAISISRDKDDDTIGDVSICAETYLDRYYVNYDTEDGKDNALHHTLDDSEINCVGYNLTDDEVSSEWDAPLNECPIDDLERIKDLREYRDSLLSENDLTLKELYEWAVWYYKNN